MELQIRGKNAFVSGATKGTGAAIAEALAEEGVKLFLVSRSSDGLELRLRLSNQP